MENNTIKEPLFHVVKRDDIKPLYKVIIYGVSILIALLIGAIMCSIVGRGNPIKFFTALFEGVLGTERKIWVFLQQTFLLVGVSMALVPAFKMKFWNLGANGQVIIGALATVACMYYFGGVLPDGVVILLMVITSIVSAVIWAVIPALLKAFFNTNESLLTLMMNYIASGLVSFCIATWVTSGSGTMKPIEYANLPELGNPYVLIILVGVLLSVFMIIYLKYSKHGYEISVVGDSQNTAKYVGINVKKVIIRTMVLSGAICGIVGLLLGGAISHMIGVNIVNNMGFTAIMTTWLANCNPIFMLLTCALVTFVNKGMETVRMQFSMTNDSIAKFVIGIVYFFIIACAFFIRYRLIFRKRKVAEKDFMNTAKKEEN